MATNVSRITGRSEGYRPDRGNMPVEFGPYIGEVVNNVDSTRGGRLQVYIEQFSGGDKTDKTLWRTVSPLQPSGGATPKTSTSAGPGTFGSTNNQQSYGAAITSPDIGTKVLCLFVAGDPNGGYWIGIVPTQGTNHMVPALGATTQFVAQNINQSIYFANSSQLPVTEINNADQNTEITESSKFFDKSKPVHSYAASTLFQQGIVNDPIRGPITSSSQRESPSTTVGFSTPGRPIYQGGLQDSTIQQQVSSGSVPPDAANIVGRRGGHTFVMDDGDISGKNSVVRIRTAKGHQITMSDDGNCFYIAHASGQVWLEFGQEGTLDVYSTNSINLRTEGTLNLHADKDFNVFAGGNINMKSNISTTMQSEGSFTCANKGLMSLFSQIEIGVKSNGLLAFDSKTGSWNGGGSLVLQAGGIDFNPGFANPVPIPAGLVEYTMPDSSFDSSTGWAVSSAGIKSIVTRAPAHEPWPYHNQGVQVNINLSNGSNSSPPGAPTVPDGVAITKTNAG